MKTPSEILARQPWMAQAEPQALERLAAASRLVRYTAGQIVSSRGEPATALVVVVSGRLEICMHGRDGRRHVIRQAGPGALFGLVPIIDQRPSIHDAIAQNGLVLLQVPKEPLLDELQHRPRLAMGLLALICQRSRRIYDLLAYQQLLSLDARVADLLIAVWRDVSPEDRAARELHVTQTDLSDMLGVSRQSLNTCLRNLEQRQLIERMHGRIRLLDREALRRYASEFL